MTKRDENYRDQVLRFMADRFDPAQKLAEKLDEQLHAADGDKPLWNVQQRASAELAEILGAQAPRDQRLSHSFADMTTEELDRALEEAMKEFDVQDSHPETLGHDTERESD